MYKSPIKWVGGKSWLIPKINQEYSLHRSKNFYDVFTGGGTVALNAKAKDVFASDINSSLINFHNKVKLGWRPDVKKLEFTKEEYHRIRDLFNEAKGENSDREAFYFYYLNKMGFNGLYRENKAGKFNVPKGTANHLPPITIPQSLGFIEYSNLGYDSITTRPDSFIYLDPPYDGSFTSYSGEMTWDTSEQEKLVKWALSQGNPFMLSNRGTESMIDLYRSYGLRLEYFDKKYNMRAKGKPEKITEIAAFNY